MKNHNDDVLMVLNPHRNKLYNVMPLFNLEAMNGGFEQSFETLDEVIKLFVCVMDETVLTIHNARGLIEELYFVRDMFKELSRCEISVPEKKGGAK